jgi:hypothetical protein
MTPLSQRRVTAGSRRRDSIKSVFPLRVVEAALGRLSSDAGAMYDDAVIAALKAIRQKSESEYARLAARAKGCITRLDKLTALERDSHQDSIQDLILSAARSGCNFGHDADGRGIATIETGDHREAWYVDSQGFKDWLRAAFYKAHQTGIPEPAMNTAISTLSAIAKHDGSGQQLHVRAAKVGDAYFLDLCDDKWRVIRIDRQGWSIVDRSPVLFTRNKNLRQLPVPVGKGDVGKLWQHVNIPESRHLLTLAWLVDCLRPDTPYPILELSGEQGSAKSSTQRHLRDLIDPNKVPLRGRPKTVEDIYVSAANNHVVSLENISHLTPEQQDALCTLSTGGGFATRLFYTNGEEHVLETKRPVMINGINPVATQADLLERTISIEAPTIPPGERKDEQTLESEWLRDYAAIFAGLLDLFAEALGKLPEVKLTTKHRMADYQLLGEAIAQVQGKAAGDFSALYSATITEGIDRSLETYGIANALQVFMSSPRKTWTGTYLSLYGELSNLPGIDRSNWPRSPRSLSGQLKRLSPGLRQIGIIVESLGHSRKGTEIRVVSSREAE